jgi:hypothetical protein
MVLIPPNPASRQQGRTNPQQLLLLLLWRLLLEAPQARQPGHQPVSMGQHPPLEQLLHPQGQQQGSEASC